MKITITFTINDRIAFFFRKLYRNRTRIFFVMAVMLCSSIVYTASSTIGTLNAFMDSDIVYASVINDNFKTLYDKINEINNYDIESLKSQLSNGATGSSGDTIGTILKKYNDDYNTINEMITQLQAGNIPKGIIAMWPSETPPTNWTLCNGKNEAGEDDENIPDLSDKFVVGASKDTGDISSVPEGVEDYPDKTYKVGQFEDSPEHFHNIEHEHLGVSTVKQKQADCHDSVGCSMAPKVHNHQWISFLNYGWSSNFDDAQSVNVVFKDGVSLNTGGGFFPFLVPVQGEVEYYTTGVNDINHEVNVQKESGFKSSSTGTEPPYKVLYYIYKYQ